MASSDIFSSNKDLSRFVDQLARVPWFENIGRAVSPNNGVKQIFSWAEWGGPEDSALAEISCRQQSYYDELIQASKNKAANEVWERIQSIVFQNAIPRVPYDANRDTWYGPTAAVWHAAWTAGLIALCLFLSQAIPADLQDQWDWFAQGHWPCGWMGEYPKGKLMVY
jgi:hypothetical protein